MYNWALNGNQDPAGHVIREEEWHGGSGAIEQRIRRSIVRSAKPTVAQYIVTESGILARDQVEE